MITIFWDADGITPKTTAWSHFKSSLYRIFNYCVKILSTLGTGQRYFYHTSTAYMPNTMLRQGYI